MMASMPIKGEQVPCIEPIEVPEHEEVNQDAEQMTANASDHLGSNFESPDP